MLFDLLLYYTMFAIVIFDIFVNFIFIFVVILLSEI